MRYYCLATIDAVFVSTDDDDIAKVAIESRAILIERPAELGMTQAQSGYLELARIGGLLKSIMVNLMAL